MQRAFCLVLMLLVAAPLAHAQGPFQASFPPQTDLDGTSGIRVVSGAMEAHIPDAEGGQLYTDVTGFRITGLERVCHFREEGSALPACWEGALELRVVDRGGVLLNFWEPVQVRISADHALTLFADAASLMEDRDSPAELGNSSFSLLTGGEVSITDVPPLALVPPPDGDDTDPPSDGEDGNGTDDGNNTEPDNNSTEPDNNSTEPGGNNTEGNNTDGGAGDDPLQPFDLPQAEDFLFLMTFSASTRVEVTDESGVRTVIEGREQRIGMQGAPQFAPFTARVAGAPITDGASYTFRPAGTAAAAAGIAIDDLASAFSSISDDGDAGEAPAAPGEGGPASDPIAVLMQEILNGAVLGLPGDGGDEFLLVRFNELTVRQEGETLTWQGDAPLQVQGSTVAGAPKTFLLLPVWTWLLWILALGVWITRLVRRPEQGARRDVTEEVQVDGPGGETTEEVTREEWTPPPLEQYRWVGRVTAPLALILLFVLWDRQVNEIVGASVMTSELSGSAFWLILLIQMGSLMMVFTAIAWPLGIIARNGLLLARQGRIPGPYTVAIVVSAFLGSALLLGFLDVLTGVLADLLSQQGEQAADGAV